MIVTCILLAVAFVAVTNIVVIASTAPYTVSEEEAATKQADAILVLGASVLPDGTPSTVLQDRLNKAAELYSLGAAANIIVSGDGRATSYNEPAAMKEYLIAQGIPSDAIFCDRAGYCTYDSAWRAANVFNCKSLIVVTQSYHLSRALYSVRAFGVDALGVSADAATYANQSYYDLREIPARAKDLIYALIGKKSTLYGDPTVDLSDSGDITNDQRY